MANTPTSVINRPAGSGTTPLSSNNRMARVATKQPNPEGEHPQPSRFWRGPTVHGRCDPEDTEGVLEPSEVDEYHANQDRARLGWTMPNPTGHQGRIRWRIGEWAGRLRREDPPCLFVPSPRAGAPRLKACASCGNAWSRFEMLFSSQQGSGHGCFLSALSPRRNRFRSSTFRCWPISSWKPRRPALSAFTWWPHRAKSFDALLEDRGTLHAHRSHLDSSLFHATEGLEVFTHLQHEPKGVGNALEAALDAVSGPMLVMLGDNLLMDTHASVEHYAASQASKRLVEAFAATGEATVGLMEVEAAAVSNYGIVALNDGRIVEVVEKPAPEDAPSQLAMCGRYVFRSETQDLLKTYTYEAPRRPSEHRSPRALDARWKPSRHGPRRHAVVRFGCTDVCGCKHRWTTPFDEKTCVNRSKRGWISDFSADLVSKRSAVREVLRRHGVQPSGLLVRSIGGLDALSRATTRVLEGPPPHPTATARRRPTPGWLWPSTPRWQGSRRRWNLHEWQRLLHRLQWVASATLLQNHWVRPCCWSPLRHRWTPPWWGSVMTGPASSWWSSPEPLPKPESPMNHNQSPRSWRWSVDVLVA